MASYCYCFWNFYICIASQLHTSLWVCSNQLSVCTLATNVVYDISILYSGNFWRGDFDVFDAFQPDHQNLTRQIFKAMQHLVKDSDHPVKIFSIKYLKSQHPSKFPSIKISRYTVLILLQVYSQQEPLHCACKKLMRIFVDLLWW